MRYPGHDTSGSARRGSLTSLRGLMGRSVHQLRTLVLRRPESAVAWTADARQVHELPIWSPEFCAEPLKREKQPTMARESDHLIVLRGGRAIHMGKAVTIMCSRQRQLLRDNVRSDTRLGWQQWAQAVLKPFGPTKNGAYLSLRSDRNTRIVSTVWATPVKWRARNEEIRIHYALPESTLAPINRLCRRRNCRSNHGYYSLHRGGAIGHR